jgi:hypothetical protein
MCGPGPDKVGPTYDQRVQADINEKMWDYYQQNYKPLVDKYSKNITDPTTVDLKAKKVTGQVNADVMKLAKPATPNSAISNQKTMMDVADVGAAGKQNAATSAKAREIGETQNVINIGRGQTTKAMTSLETMAAMSVDEALRNKQRELESATMTENSIGSAAGTAAGLAVGGYRRYRNRPKTTTTQ